MTGLRSRVLLAVLSLGVLAFFAPTAHASPGIIRVQVNGRASPPCGDNADWSNACTLSYAMSIAVSGDELWVASGIYTPTITGDRAATFTLHNGIALYGGFAGTENARNQRNIAANLTILSGDIDHNDSASPATNTSQIVGNNSYHVITGSGTDCTAVLD